MDAVEFFKTVNRLCKKGCKKCPIYKERMCMSGFDDDSVKNIVEKVLIVEKWAKDHPVKTRQSEMLKIFPDTRIYSGVIYLCPQYFLPEEARKAYCEKRNTCQECRKEYWLTEVTDND